MVAVKQVLKVKNVNPRDVQRSISDNFKEVTGWLKSKCEIGVVNTYNGISIMIVRNIKLKKYKIITLGASVKDITFVDKKLESCRYHFEYIMEVDGSTFGNKTVSAIIKDCEEAKFNEALILLKAVGICAKNNDDVLIGNMSMNVKLNKADEIPTIILTTSWETENDDNKKKEVIIDSFARAGKMKFVQVVVANKAESEVLFNINDNGICALTCLEMIRDGKAEYIKDRAQTFNFAKILPLEKLEEKGTDKLGLDTEEDGKTPIIDTMDKFNKALELLYA